MIIIDEDGIMHDVVPKKVLEQIRDEIFEWGKEPARYVQNYDAYIRFLELIDKYIKEQTE